MNESTFQLLSAPGWPEALSDVYSFKGWMLWGCSFSFLGLRTNLVLNNIFFSLDSCTFHSTCCFLKPFSLHLAERENASFMASTTPDENTQTHTLHITYYTHAHTHTHASHRPHTYTQTLPHTGTSPRTPSLSSGGGKTVLYHRRGWCPQQDFQNTSKRHLSSVSIFSKYSTPMSQPVRPLWWQQTTLTPELL